MSLKLENWLKIIKKLGFVTQKLIEYAEKYTVGDVKNKLERIYEEISPKNISTLCDRLRSYGYIFKE